MRTSTLSALSVVALTAFGFLALGSSKSDKSSSTDPAASGSAAAKAGGGEKKEVLATCNIKSLGKCTENYGMVPTLAADLCKGDEGVFSKGSTPCPTEGVIGSCEFKAK